MEGIGTKVNYDKIYAQTTRANNSVNLPRYFSFHLRSRAMPRSSTGR